MTDQYRIIGQLEAQMESLQERTDRIETKLDVLTEHIQQQKGGLRTLLLLAGAAGTAGAVLTKLLAMMKGGA